MNRLQLGLAPSPSPCTDSSLSVGSLDEQVTEQEVIRISFDEFADAASRLMTLKRPPRGSKGAILSDTLLLADRDGLLVETSAVSSLVATKGQWVTNVSVDARKLVEICGTLRKLGAAGNEVDISVANRQFRLKL